MDDKAYVFGTVMCYIVMFILLCAFLYMAIIGGEIKKPEDRVGPCVEIFIFMAIVAGIGVFCSNKYKRKVAAVNTAYNKNAEIRKKYQEACAEVEKKNQSNRSKYNRNLKEWEEATGKNIQYLTQKRDEISKTLEQYYMPDVIFAKYRSLPALTSIYEYLTSGRCKELTGPNGAYNLYEMELRQNIVISQLSTIISNLEQIRKNQFVLYQELTKVTTATKSVANEISQIRDYSKQLTELATLNTYYNAVTAQSASAIAFMQMMG